MQSTYVCQHGTTRDGRYATPTANCFRCAVTPCEWHLVPEGFRAVRFGDGGTTTYAGIVRVGAETWSGGLMPFVTVPTMQSIVGALHRVYPTPETAHAVGVDWIDLVPMLGNYWDVVVYNASEDHSHGYMDGFPVDPNSWGTLNLLDEDDYRAAHPGEDEWLDLGCVGLVWHEV